MSSIFSNYTKITIAVASGIGVITFGIWLKNYLDSSPFKKWRLVGELNDLICYPIKSCGPIRCKTMECSKIGLHDGYLKDRGLLVVRSKLNENGNYDFVTGRQYPKMVLIKPKMNDTIMSLSAPGMMDIELNMANIKTLIPVTTCFLGQNVKARDCGDDMARWLSRYLLSEDSGLRLVHYLTDLPMREVRESKNLSEDSGAFHDETSFMLFNESSLADLNSKLPEPVTILHFRPNFVVKGPLPYEEDYWKWIKIGDEVIFRNVKPCSRCIFTTVNPETAQKSPDGNPLKKLREYRPKISQSPCLGIHLGARYEGKIKIGDPVYVK